MSEDVKVEKKIDGVTLYTPMESSNPVARRNLQTIVEFFSLYLKDKERFYSLWVAAEPQVVTPFTSGDIAICNVVVHSGWTAVKRFWDPIFDEMKGTFDWFVDDFIPGENPNIVVTRTHSTIDVQGGKTWGNKRIAYNGRYVQIFRFEGGRVKSFEEYYDTALLNSKFGG